MGVVVIVDDHNLVGTLVDPQELWIRREAVPLLAADGVATIRLSAAAAHAATTDSAHAPHPAHSTHSTHAATPHASTPVGVSTSATGIAAAAGSALLDFAVLLRILDLLLRIIALVLVEIPVTGQLRFVLRARHCCQRRRKKNRCNRNCSLCCKAENFCHRIPPF